MPVGGALVGLLAIVALLDWTDLRTWLHQALGL
jgi:hypothetical protein